MSMMHFYNNMLEATELFYESHRQLIEKILIHLGKGDEIEEYCERFLGDKLKFKKQKDPNKPKRPLSAYLYFCKEKRDKIKTKHPEWKLGEISKELGQAWKNLSEKEKNKYMDLHVNDKERYIEEYETFLENKDY